MGAGYRGRHNKLFYFQMRTFSVTATQGSGCSFCALESMSRHQVGMKKSYQRPNFHCLILTLYHRTGLPWTGFKFDALSFLIFLKACFFYDALEMLHPVCATDTSLINQWNANMTVRISSCPVLQTLLGERKGNF